MSSDASFSRDVGDAFSSTSIAAGGCETGALAGICRRLPEDRGGPLGNDHVRRRLPAPSGRASSNPPQKVQSCSFIYCSASRSRLLDASEHRPVGGFLGLGEEEHAIPWQGKPY